MDGESTQVDIQDVFERHRIYATNVLYLLILQDNEQKERNIIYDWIHFRFSAKLESALKDGSVDLKIMKCLFQGPPRVGKTHLMCLLLQIVVEKLGLNSTGCAEHPRRAVRTIGFGAASGKEEKWEVINDDVLASLIGQAAAKLNIDHGHQEDESGEDESGEDEVVDAVSQVKSKITSEHLSSLAPKRDQFKELLYFIDSGGQSQFQEVLQAFIPNASMLLLAFKLTEKLSDFPTMVYQSNLQSSHSLGKYALTNEEIISRCARMVYSSGNSVHVALAGTHRDQYSESEHETIEDKNSQLSKVFSFCKDRLLFQNLFDGDLVFPINGKQAVEGFFDDPVVCQLRSEIASALESVPAIKVPLRWYGLELVLQQHATTTGKQVLSLDMCKHMSTSLQFASQDVPAALKFLSSYNLILYYPKLLPKVVFTTPQVLLDKVTELTECVYALAGGSDAPAHQMPRRGEYLRMRNEGIISRGILRDSPKHYVPGLFTEKELLLIFERLYIVAQVDEGRYFMPSLLPHFAPNELKQLSTDPSKPAPLLFHFKDGCAPAGLFCALLVCLTSPRIGWEVCLEPPLGGVRSNAACLFIPNTRCLTTIVDAFHHFEVHCKFPKGRERHLPTVNEVVTEALEEVIHNRKYAIPFPKKSFFCRSTHPVSRCRVDDQVLYNFFILSFNIARILHCRSAIMLPLLIL